ncbi:putative RNA-binding protein (Jag domain) [Campylobacter iguaniorum]|uniref:Jag N-terminal domain-containing protein n=1 Tax=Campylobacter iguaniorum TaxID=1244531 RepID=UPI0007C96EB9|nr:Jag N-terminal domain-containing protein [Campylobacter iguaniorum]ANE35606.1 putative RNA-binding protein (Jag domain) [Campylobacter iguaniorum]
MKAKIQAPNLQQAYIKGAEELKCSVTDMDVKILQHPRSGIFGFFQRDAIIEVSTTMRKPQKEYKNDTQKSEHFDKKKDKKKKPPKQHFNKTEESTQPQNNHQQPPKESTHQPKENIPAKPKKLEIDNSIFDAFHKGADEEEVQKPEQAKKEIKPEIIEEIKAGLDRVFKASSFNINVVDVAAFDSETVFVKLDGEDAALLIGKEGYRYKAVSYLLFNWINSKYDLGIRLEIAEFLKNQEAGIASYLAGVIDRVENSGRAQTKPLDGVLVKIALEQLRERFPNKYVGIKNGDDGRYVVVNDFYKK